MEEAEGRPDLEAGRRDASELCSLSAFDSV